MQIQKFNKQHDNQVFDLTNYSMYESDLKYYALPFNNDRDYIQYLRRKDIQENGPLYQDSITGEYSRIASHIIPSEYTQPHCPVCHNKIVSYSTSNDTIYNCQNTKCQLNKCCFTKEQIDSNPAFKNNLLYI